MTRDAIGSVVSSKGPDAHPFRILVAKAGMDGHDRGARVVARALRDDGMEVIYTGRHVMIASIARIALDEDVDVIGLSILSGAHVAHARSLLAALDEIGIRHQVEVVVGGTVQSAAVRDQLLALGVADVFPGATPLPEVVRRVGQLASRRRQGVFGS